MREYDEQFLTDRLQRITPRFRLIFALAISGRLFLLYELYTKRTDRGSPDTLRLTLDRLWDQAPHDSAGRHDPFLNEYETLIPDDDAHWHPLNGVAENAVAALAYACHLQKSGDPQFAVWAARCGYEAVDYIAHALEGMSYDTPEDRAAILNRRYVQSELEYQSRDIEDLENVTCEEIDFESIIGHFRTRAHSEGRSLAKLVSLLSK